MEEYLQGMSHQKIIDFRSCFDVRIEGTAVQAGGPERAMK
jgi:hypothetical protein